MSLNSNNILELEKLMILSSTNLFHKIKTTGVYRIILIKLGTKMPKAKDTIPRPFIKLMTITKGEVTIDIKLMVLSLKVCSNACKNELKTLYIGLN